jgi:hypothetical protein
MTAGVAFNARTVDLMDGWVHECVLVGTRNREQNELEAIQWRKQLFENSKRKVEVIREKNSDPEKWNVMELHTMVAWFKCPGDSNIPKCKEQLLQQYLLTCHRSEQEPKWKKDDELAVSDSVEPANDGDEGGIAEVVPCFFSGTIACFLQYHLFAWGKNKQIDAITDDCALPKKAFDLSFNLACRVVAIHSKKLLQKILFIRTELRLALS